MDSILVSSSSSSDLLKKNSKSIPKILHVIASCSENNTVHSSFRSRSTLQSSSVFGQQKIHCQQYVTGGQAIVPFLFFSFVIVPLDVNAVVTRVDIVVAPVDGGSVQL